MSDKNAVYHCQDVNDHTSYANSIQTDVDGFLVISHSSPESGNQCSVWINLSPADKRALAFELLTSAEQEESL